MPSVVRVQYTLPDAQFLNELLRDDLILRYVKDDYSRSEHCLEFYDTDNWSLMSRGFSLSVTRSRQIPVIELQQGLRLRREFPGLYEGIQYVAPYEQEGDMVEPLMLVRYRRPSPVHHPVPAGPHPGEHGFRQWGAGGG